ncbi:Kinetochore protein NDC80 [Hirschfeldia incana]|nr:Kinetochore protein NDC80 [Hirschfeldia incana]
MRGANGKRKPTGSFAEPPPPPPSLDYQRQLFKSRDSDASFASSHQSISRASDVYTTNNRSHQSDTIRSINAFLASHNSPISLRAHPVPPVKDISETLVFILSTVDFHCDDARRWDEDVVFFLKSLSCPLKLTKSTLRAPNSPHNWPHVLAVIGWLVQYARFCNQLSSSNPEADSMTSFGIRSYCHFIRGEDDAVNDLDSEFLGKLEAEKVNIAETISGSEHIAGELEAKVDQLRKGPSRKEVLEKAKADLEKDVNKFRTMVVERTERNRGMERLVEEKEKEVVVKEEERGRILEENKELKKSVEVQSFNVRDVERMKRELQAVERDVEEAEGVRDGWEQKAWEVNSKIGNQFHQIQRVGIDCNQALRRLKVDVQFSVNESGKGHEEVMGVEYKAKVKPALCSLYDGVKEGSTKKVEELVYLQQQVSEIASKMESRKSLLRSVQLQINEVEEKMKLVKKETQDFAAKCDLEAKTMAGSVKTEEMNLEAVEKEAAEMLKGSEVRVEEAVKQSEEEVQAVAAQLFALIDSISKHKEYMDSKILEVKTGVADTATAVSEIYKGSLKRHLGG